MGQPSKSAQVRAVALREAVASMPPLPQPTMDVLDVQERMIIGRAERFAHYIEEGIEEDDA